MALEVDAADVFKTKDGLTVIPLRWLASGRIFCRVEQRSMGVVDTTWKALPPHKIQGKLEDLTKILGECPVNIMDEPESDILSDMGVL